MDFSKIKKIYMIGIKGVGMTMLAQFLVSKGYDVSGSDTAEVFMTDQVLAKFGIKVFEVFREKNIPPDADLIIYSSAYRPDTNIEVAAAMSGRTTPDPSFVRRGASNNPPPSRVISPLPACPPWADGGLRGVGEKKGGYGTVKILTYAEVLGELFNQMYGIAVCGSHGKTTTTAWLGYVLWKAGLAPNVLVGARAPQFDGAGVFGKSNYMVIEADEYQNKLKYYNPKMILLNNIDHDHHDFFPTLENYIEAFTDFMGKLSRKGFLIANFDDEHIAKTANVKKVNCEAREATLGCCRGKVVSYALNREDVNYFAYDIKQAGLKQFFKVSYLCEEAESTKKIDKKLMSLRAKRSNPVVVGKNGIASPAVRNDREELGDFSISLLGRHNIYNALAVIAAAIELGVELKDIRTYLEEFSGTDRRMRVMGKFRGATIIDDYGHHPTEIKTTLAGLRAAYPKNKITAVFHPHTFTRTKALLDEFAQSFSDADKVIVLDIYGSAREAQGGVSSLDLIAKISAFAKATADKKEILHVADLKACEEYLRAHIERDEIVILIGAGDIFRVGEALINN